MQFASYGSAMQFSRSWCNKFGVPVWWDDEQYRKPNVHLYFVEADNSTLTAHLPGSSRKHICFLDPLPDKDHAGNTTLAQKDESTLSTAESSELEKYWNQRYRLFQRFDDGIEMDQGEC